MRSPKIEELTFSEEQSRDEKYMNALRAIPRPTSVDTLEKFAADYRMVFCQRYPHMKRMFESVGLHQ